MEEVPAIRIKGLNKCYRNGFQALSDVSLEVRRGEIFALLGPNGAGKTTLIGSICGIVQPTSGQIEVMGHDAISDYRRARSCIGLVPQELSVNVFEKVFNTVTFSRGLFGKAKDPAMIEALLKRFTLWDKRNSQLKELSGGMKRRVMIAKALAHEPQILFLDEPSAGIDVELRKRMWEAVEALRDMGVTVILTTHYIEEAEAIADRIGVIDQGRMLVVEEKSRLMERLGRKQMIFELREQLEEIPEALSEYALELSEDGNRLLFSYKPFEAQNDVSRLLDNLRANGIRPKDISVRESSLEEIFVELVKGEHKHGTLA